MSSLTDEIREKAARVARKATRVRIDEGTIETYARELPAESPPAPDLEGADEETRAAFSLQLNAINFGSGWFPTLRKPEGLSGFRTVEAGLRRRGPFAVEELRQVTAPQIAAVLGQDPEHELMALFARALRELGERIGDSFLGLAGLGVTGIAAELATWPTWYDISPYDGEAIPLFKRAQIAAADLALSGLTDPAGLAELTLFADNLVPHVLRIDGVLRFDAELVARIDAGTLLAHDSPEEVEIRAVALHAVELLVAAHGATTATAIDNVLWHRGAGSEYKAHPRHRARTTAY